MKRNINDLFRFFKDQHSRADADALEAWLHENPRNLETFSRAFRLFQAESFLLEERKRKKSWRPLAAAAAVAAVFMAGFLVNRELETRPVQRQLTALSRQENILQTAPGERVKLTLPDGSRVHLNADSRLTYSSFPGGHLRRVSLCGEALFEVKSDPAHPFVVETFGHRIKATGTRFNVSASESEGSFSATLMSGKVLVSDREGKDERAMKPGQLALWDGSGLSVRDVEDPEEAALWSRGIISISGVPFDRLMKIFERSFGVSIVIECRQLPEIRYGMAKVRISNGIGYAFSVLQKRSAFQYRYDEETQTYHIY